MSSTTASSNGHGPSSSASTIPTELRWEQLSDRSQAILRVVAARIMLGYSEREIALELGTTRRWVSSRLDELRDELKRLPR